MKQKRAVGLRKVCFVMASLLPLSQCDCDSQAAAGKQSKIDKKYCQGLGLEYGTTAEGKGYCHPAAGSEDGGVEGGTVIDEAFCAAQGLQYRQTEDGQGFCYNDLQNIDCASAEEGEACDDQNVCTFDDACRSGVCVGNPMQGYDDHNPCTEDSCDPLTGEVSHNSAPLNGATCNDNDPCSNNDQCLGGVCSGDYSVDLSGQPIDDGDACTRDFCDGQGRRQNVPYTAQEAAVLGLGGVTMEQVTNPCQQFVCVIGAGQVPHMDALEGVDCSDAVAGRSNGDCVSWICQAGHCAGIVDEEAVLQAPIYGGQDLNPHCRMRQCHTSSGRVEYVPDPNRVGVLCDDGNDCTHAEICAVDGSCGGHTFAQGHSCDDKNPCTGGDHCDDGLCVAAVDFLQRALDPDDSFDPAGIKSSPGCLSYVCHPELGLVVDGTALNGTPCDDHNDCSSDDTCSDGLCLGNSEATDDQPCDTEADETDCRHGLCAKGVCTNLTQQHAVGTSCVGGQECRLYQCDSSGSCVAFSDATDGTECGPGNSECQTNTCVGGACVAQDAASGTACVTRTVFDHRHDSCVALTCSAGDCVASSDLPLGSPCDDGNVCNGPEQCSGGGVCVEVNTLTRDDVGGHDNEDWADGTPTLCDDGDPCTRLSFCDDGYGGCQPGVPIAGIDDNNPCTVDLCAADSGEISHLAVANNTPCDDGDPCTMRDLCLEGECHGNRAPDGHYCDLPELQKDPNKPARCQAEVCMDGACVIDTSAQVGVPCDDGEAICSRPGRCDADGLCVVDDTAAGYGEDCSPSLRDSPAINSSAADTGVRFVDAPCWIWECDETGFCAQPVAPVADPGPGGGVACDLDADGDPCDDICVAGVCTSIVEYVAAGGTDTNIVQAHDLALCDNGDGNPCNQVCLVGACVDLTQQAGIPNGFLNLTPCTDSNICTGGHQGMGHPPGTALSDMDICVDGLCRGRNLTVAGAGAAWACQTDDGNPCDHLCDDGGDASAVPVCSSASVGLAAIDPQRGQPGVQCEDNNSCTTHDVCGGGSAGQAGVCGGVNLLNGSQCPDRGPVCDFSCWNSGSAAPVATCENLPAAPGLLCADQNVCTQSYCGGGAEQGLCISTGSWLAEGAACTHFGTMADDPNPCDEFCLDHDGDDATAPVCVNVESHGVGGESLGIGGNKALDALNGTMVVECNTLYGDPQDPCTAHACYQGGCRVWDQTLTGFGAHPAFGLPCGTGIEYNACVENARCGGDNLCSSYSNVADGTFCAFPQCSEDGHYVASTCQGGVCTAAQGLLGSCSKGVATCRASACAESPLQMLCNENCQLGGFDLVNGYEDLAACTSLEVRSWRDELVSPSDFGASQQGAAAFDQRCTATPANAAERDACDDGSVLVATAELLDLTNLPPAWSSEGLTQGFWFYNRRYTHLSISVNGAVVFHRNNPLQEDPGDPAHTEFVLPFVGPEADFPTLPMQNSGARSAQVMPFKDDLTLIDSGQTSRRLDADILTYHAGGPTDTPWDDYLVIQWNNLGFFGCADSVMSFQMKWWFWTGQIAFVYPERGNSDGAVGETCIPGRSRGGDAEIGLRDEDETGDSQGDPQHLVGVDAPLVTTNSGPATESFAGYYVFWPGDKPITHYDWRGWMPFADIADSGEMLPGSSGCDSCCDRVELPQPIFYNGVPRWFMYVCAGGYLHFQDPADSVFQPQSQGNIPLVDRSVTASLASRDFIAPWWLDGLLFPSRSPATGVYWELQEGDQGPVLVVQWDRVEFDYSQAQLEMGEDLCSDNSAQYGSAAADCDEPTCACAVACGGQGCGITFQVLLHSELGLVEFRYLSSKADYGSSALQNTNRVSMGLNYQPLFSGRGTYGVDLADLTPVYDHNLPPARPNSCDRDEAVPGQQLNVLLMQSGALRP